VTTSFLCRIQMCSHKRVRRSSAPLDRGCDSAPDLKLDTEANPAGARKDPEGRCRHVFIERCDVATAEAEAAIAAEAGTCNDAHDFESTLSCAHLELSPP